MKLKEPLVIKLSEADKIKAIKRSFNAEKFSQVSKEKIHRNKKTYLRRLKHPRTLIELEK